LACTLQFEPSPVWNVQYGSSIEADGPPARFSIWGCLNWICLDDSSRLGNCDVHCIRLYAGWGSSSQLTEMNSPVWTDVTGSE
jgi:hypothetical protein